MTGLSHIFFQTSDRVVCHRRIALFLFKPYFYKKEDSSFDAVNSVSVRKRLSFKPSKKLAKSILSLALFTVGIFVLAFRVLVPIVSVKAKTLDLAPILSPVSEDSQITLSALEDEAFSFEELNANFMRSNDYGGVDGIISYDFNESPSSSRINLPSYFYLTIPKLKVFDALVEVNSSNLDPTESLGHYPKSCLPDEACNSFVFGHSTYRNSKNKYREGDYTEIFAKLDELEYGDEFSINYRGKVYRYVVELTKVQRPEDVNPLESPLPRNLGQYESSVELFTCTPPGSTKYRLSVVGRLVE